MMLMIVRIVLFAAGMTSAAVTAGDNRGQSDEWQQCSKEAAPLLRLDCYDRLMSREPEPAIATARQSMGVAWQRAITHERGRSDHSTGLLVTDSGGENPQVVLTTPAVGLPPPRPVLMFSCVDNITRLQVALTKAIKKTEGAVTLTTQRTRYSADWFVRENGFLLESSRGLAGIDEIKRLFDAQSLTLVLPQTSTRLVFDITGLAQTIGPLRNACHW